MSKHGAAMLCPCNMIHAPLLLFVWGSSSTEKASERCLNLMCWRPVGCDDIADDLGNVMCKKNVISHARNLLRVYVCNWEKVGMFRGVHVLLRQCLFTLVFTLPGVTLLPCFALSLDLLVLKEAGRCTAVCIPPPSHPLHPHILQHLPAFMSAPAEQSSPQGRWVCSYHVSGKYII